MEAAPASPDEAITGRTDGKLLDTLAAAGEEYVGVFRHDLDMVVKRVFGDVPEVAEGQVFASRVELMAAGVHRAGRAGIVGNGADGAESIVVSGGYEDDEDYGEMIIYTGHGGNDQSTGRQIADQSLESSGNAALVTSSLTGTPVRVVRGPHRGSAFAPTSGYRYDGLFRVESWWTDPGKRGFRICRYRLVKLAAELPAALCSNSPAYPPDGEDPPARRVTLVQRMIRSSAVAEHVKQLHGHTCQICGVRLSVRGRGYSEAAYIRPLGRPHDGPDVPENVLCLCPNCHALFEYGEIRIDERLSVMMPGGPTPLTTLPGHRVEPEHLRYHREHHQG